LADCTTCPSYLSADDFRVVERFGKNAGAPTCGRYGYMLGTKSSTPEDREQIALKFASECDAYGEPMLETPVTITPHVTSVAPEALVDNQPDSIKMCTNCENCVSDSAVYNQFGWALPLCKATGQLIFKPVQKAKGCPWQKPGHPTSSLFGVELRDVYRPGYRVPVKAVVDAFLANSHCDIEPSEYETDMPVSDEDRSHGIRAWRRVTDPHGFGKEVYLPIFDRDSFTEEERALIPSTGGQGHPELYVDYDGLLYQFAVESYTLDETPAIIGEPGTGKTQFGRWLAWLCQLPFRRLQNNREMDVEELLGSQQYSPEKGTYFEPGIMPISWQLRGVLMDDEPNVGPDAAWQVRRPLTDNSKELIIGDHRFTRNDYCFYLMSMNPSYDPRNLGTNELADADTNRLSFLFVSSPPDPVERHIMKTYCKTLDGYDISDETIELLMRIAADIREAAEEGSFPGSWATRQQIKVARKTAWYPLPEAYKIAALNNIEPETAGIILDAIATHTGEEVEPSKPLGGPTF
jgi:MoxR-like ATPase